MVAQPQPPGELLGSWGLTPIALLKSGRRNQHWLVSTGSSELVLRATRSDIAYELELQRRLQRLDWPVAELVRQPHTVGDATFYLFTRLPGEPRADGPHEQRERGRLLAALHESTAQMDDLMGQRPGWLLSSELLNDPELEPAIMAYERLQPREGGILRGYLDWARARLGELDLRQLERIVVHGDFAPWNLLFDNDRLSGILDFEFSHLDYRVADFALSWRGDKPAVLAGYEDIRPLAELDRALLAPTFVAWLFIGMASFIGDILDGRAAVHDFDWQIRHLLRVQLTT